MSGQQQIRDGEMQIYFGKQAFDSLLQSMFAGEGHLNLMNDSIKMTVAKLDDMAYGYENAFKEKSVVNITAQVDYIHSVAFDQQFNNIPFKADVTVFFDNPIKPSLRSAQAKIVFKGIAKLDIISSFGIVPEIQMEQLMVKQFKAFFYSETSRQEF